MAEECNHEAVILVISVVLEGCPNMYFKRMTVFRLIMTGLYSVVMARRLFVVFGVLGGFIRHVTFLMPEDTHKTRTGCRDFA